MYRYLLRTFLTQKLRDLVRFFSSSTIFASERSSKTLWTPFIQELMDVYDLLVAIKNEKYQPIIRMMSRLMPRDLPRYLFLQG
jgi:hypothetical protein